MTVPYAFANLSGNIVLAKLDANFNTPITIGNTSVLLGNTVTTLNNLTLANVTITSGTSNVTNVNVTNVTVTNLTATLANVTTLNVASTYITSANIGTLALTNALPVSSGGTGQVTFPANSVLLGNGTGGIATVAPGNVGNVLTSIGGVWVSNVVVNGAAAGANTQVQYNSSGVLAGSANLTFNGTTLTANTLNLTNALGTTYGGTGLTSFTANGVVYASSSSALTTGSALTFDGTSLLVGSNTSGYGYLNVARYPSAPYASLTITDNATPANEVGVYLRATGSNPAGISTAGAPLAFYLGGAGTSEQMRLTSTGLGIGTSSPGYKLDVEKSSDGTIGYFRRIGATVNPALTIYANETGNTVGFGTDYAGATSPAITFSIATSEKMRLDSSGNLGLGVTPSAWNGASAKAFETAGGSIANFGTGQFVSVANAYYNSGWLYKNSSLFATQYQQASGQHVWYTAPSGTAGNAITFTQAMTLDSSGSLLVGTTSTLSVGGATGFFNATTSGATRWAGAFENTNASPLGVTIRYATDANGTGNEFLWCVGNTTLRTSIRSNGGIANYSANDVNLSDRREKTNFAPAKSYLDVICAIPVQTFNYIDQNLEDDPGLTLGVVAQDVQAVAPELVSESNWGTETEPKTRLSIYQTDLQYALMKCIQEQQALIQSLTNRIAQLENKP